VTSSDDTSELPAGAFAAWATQMQRALREEGQMDVPCGGCTACCRASQFVHVAPDEAETLARIPPELLFPAPGLPDGHALLGYDERGRCPMLVDDRCSIYEHRPRACRTYDCRVFAASGIGLDEPGPVAAQARRWRFELAGAEDERRHAAVRAAVDYVGAHPDLFPDGAATATRRAVRAVEVHDRFLG
jgi:Fe-S-cluster containining protein